MKISILLVLSLLIISCGRKNPQAKIDEAKAEALKAQEAEQGEESKKLATAFEEGKKQGAEEISKEQLKLKNANESLLAQVGKLQQEKATLEKTSTDATKEKAALVKKVAEKNTEVTKLKRDIDALKKAKQGDGAKKIAELEKQIEAKNKEITDLKAKLAKQEPSKPAKPEEVSTEETQAEEKLATCEDKNGETQKGSCLFDSSNIINVLKDAPVDLREEIFENISGGSKLEFIVRHIEKNPVAVNKTCPKAESYTLRVQKVNGDIIKGFADLSFSRKNCASFTDAGDIWTNYSPLEIMQTK